MAEKKLGLNSRPLDETIAGTGPGIPDDSLAPGEDGLPQPPSEEEIERAKDKLGLSPRREGEGE